MVQFPMVRLAKVDQVFQGVDNRNQGFVRERGNCLNVTHINVKGVTAIGALLWSGTLRKRRSRVP